MSFLKHVFAVSLAKQTSVGCSTRNPGRQWLAGRGLVRKHEAFSKCPVEKLPFHDMLEMISGLMSGQSLSCGLLSDWTGALKHLATTFLSACQPILFVALLDRILRTVFPAHRRLRDSSQC